MPEAGGGGALAGPRATPPALRRRGGEPLAIYAGDDVITGDATVILAMGQGRRAAEAMPQHLTAPRQLWEVPLPPARLPEAGGGGALAGPGAAPPALRRRGG